MAGGLGKGLDSLIPDFYDEDFDSNGAKSLEDMLNDEDNSSSEEKNIEDVSNVDDISESKQDIVEDDESNVADDNVTEDEKEENEPEKPSVEEIKEENVQDSETSEDISGNTGSEENVSDTQDVKTQENVAEVLDIVDKNPRITLWSSRSAAVFRYLRKTEPEFSISREASILIDEAVSKKYPEIWKLFENL